MKAKKKLLIHFLATIAYRLQKVLRNASKGFHNFKVKTGIRTPHQIVWHMTSVLGYARTFFTGGIWKPEKKEYFHEEIDRLHEILQSLKEHIESNLTIKKTTYEKILQGPFADVMSHIGQIALLRRLFKSPVPPENFIMADINSNNLGKEQPEPVAPDSEWYDADGNLEER